MKRTLSLLLVLVMVISMVPNVFATTDNSDVDFSDLFYEKLDTYSPLVADIKANNVVGFVWTATGEGTLTYEVPENYTMTLTQDEQTVSGTGTVTMDVVADEKVYIEVVNNTAEDVEGLTIEGTFGTVCEHVAGEAVEEDRVEATCKEPGSYNSVVYCSVCGEKLSSTAVEIPVIPHTPGEAVEEDRVEATCTAVGSYNSVVYCSVCGEKLSSTAVEIPMAEHAWDEGVKYPATTEKNAYTLYTCTVCGATKEVEEEGTQLPTLAIITQPVAQHVATGSTFTFTVEATGAVSYRWQRLKTGSSTWSDCSFTGWNTPTVTIKASLANQMPYRCVITDAAGNKLISDEVTFTTYTPDPMTNWEQTGDQDVQYNKPVSFSVTVEDPSVITSYRWQKRSINGTYWTYTSVSGYDTDTITFNARESVLKYYRCRMVDKNGTIFYSDEVTFTFAKSPITLKVLDYSSAVYATNGSSVSISIVAQGSNVTYQWQKSTDGGLTYNNTGLSGNKTDTMTFNLWSTNAGCLYRCQIRDDYGNVVNSRSIKCTIIKKFNITEQPTDQVMEEGNSIQFKVTATGSDLKYRWQYIKKGATDYSYNAWTGNTTDTLTVDAKYASFAGCLFRCAITDASGTTYYTDPVTFTVAE